MCAVRVCGVSATRSGSAQECACGGATGQSQAVYYVSTRIRSTIFYKDTNCKINLPMKGIYLLDNCVEEQRYIIVPFLPISAVGHAGQDLITGNLLTLRRRG